MSLDRFLSALNAVSTRHHPEFMAHTPLSKVISPFGLCPESFILLLADATGLEEDDIDQRLILPDEDTIDSVYNKFATL